MSRGTTFGHCKKHGDYCGKTCPFCQIDELKKNLDAFVKDTGDAFFKAGTEIGLIKEILQKTLKKLADVGISGFIDEELLEKLDSKGKTECKNGEHLFQDIFDDIENRICAICGLLKNKKDLIETEKKEVILTSNEQFTDEEMDKIKEGINSKKASRGEK